MCLPKKPTLKMRLALGTLLQLYYLIFIRFINLQHDLIFTDVGNNKTVGKSPILIEESTSLSITTDEVSFFRVINLSCMYPCVMAYGERTVSLADLLSCGLIIGRSGYQVFKYICVSSY